MRRKCDEPLERKRPLRCPGRSRSPRIGGWTPSGPARHGPECKWGRHFCRPHSHRRVDAPTLQDLRRTFDPRVRQRMLSRPMSSLLPPGLATDCQRFVTGARAGIRPSLLPDLLPPPDRSPRMSAALHTRSAEAASLYRSEALRLGACAVSAALPLGQVLGLSGVAASLRSVMSRLAFGRSLLHAVPEPARGQTPPPSLGSKPR